MLSGPVRIYADGALDEVVPKNGTGFTLEELQSFVGGSVQMITLPNGLQIWMNEEGKLKEMPMNVMATLIWQVVYYGYEVGADDVVVGDVLICDPKYIK